jgi:hypothetical protein
MKLLALALAVGLTGCATRWHHPNGNTTQADYQRDHYQCEVQATSMYPAAQVAQGGQTTSFGQATTTCTGYGNQMTCRTTPPVTNTLPVYYIDANASSRNHAQRNCMAARGYTFSR